jgi:hypothetical protein
VGDLIEGCFAHLPDQLFHPDDARWNLHRFFMAVGSCQMPEAILSRA